MEKIPVTNYPMPEYLMLYDVEAAEPEYSASSAAERLVRKFESHEAEEKAVVDRYAEILRDAKNPLVKFLLELIVADEEKHYRVTRAMLSTLEGELLWTRPKDAIQGIGELRDGHGELLKLTGDFIRIEKEGIETYKTLMKETKGYYRGLFGVLLDAMIRDSEKHVGILEFLKSQLKEA